MPNLPPILSSFELTPENKQSVNQKNILIKSPGWPLSYHTESAAFRHGLKVGGIINKLTPENKP